MLTIAQALAIGIQHQQAGRLQEAGGMYRAILAVSPMHADALHLLGVVAQQSGQNDSAVDLIRKAIVANPAAFHYCLNLGNILSAQGKLEEAIAAFKRAIAIKPDYAEAHNSLGEMLRRRGLPEEAEASCRRAIQLLPGYSEAHNNLGNVLLVIGRFEEATASYRRATQLKPDFAEAYDNLGMALRRQGKLDEAIAGCRRALELKPGFVGAQVGLGNALRQAGRVDEAITSYLRALEIDPAFVSAHNNLAHAQRDKGQFDAAISSYRRAIQLDPGLLEAHHNLGATLRERGQFEEAVAVYRRALELDPDLPDGHDVFGMSLIEAGQVDQAIEAFQHVIRLDSGHPQAHGNLGVALARQGRLDEAIKACQRSLELKPDNAWVHSNLIYLLHFHPGYGHDAIAKEQKRWNLQFGRPLIETIIPHGNDRAPDRRLRIGYVSADFRNHVVGRYMLSLMESHDRQQFEILCYSGVSNPDWITDRLCALATEWRVTAGVPDAPLAEMIREDKVDILVDLSQHTAGNRLPLFARKPAPVQVSFAGYPESTGLEAIAYRISDRFLETESVFEEGEIKEQVFLIDSFYAYNPCGMVVEVDRLHRQKNAKLTFGCLGNFSKVNERVLSVWSQVLGKVENSRLMILCSAGSQRLRISEVLERQGVAPCRVEFVDYLPSRDYFKLYHQLDIILDTFPYNGGITTCDALWMGVPVVSLAGKTSVSRAGLSLLSNVGLPELVAHTESDYVDIATRLAFDAPRLAQLRSTLRDRMEASVVMDANRFTRQIEQAYREMWRPWCAGNGLSAFGGLV